MAGRLVLLNADDPDFVTRLQQAWADGDAVCPIDPRLPGPARSAVLAAIRPDEPVADGDAIVVVSSGTTGQPKAVVLTHDAVLASAMATSAHLQVDPDADRWLACLPLSHVGGLSVVTRALLTRTRLTVHPRFDAGAVERAALDGCTLTSLVPAALARVDPSLFRCILVGGQAPPPDRPPHVIATYGMTETGSGIVYEGLPLAGVDVRITDDGEIEVRAPMLLRCYRDGHDPKSSDGWYLTGDLGELTGDRLTVFGRRGDLIITGGENVWPRAVEEVLARHTAVREVAVVGRPDDEWGQRVAAVVVPEDPSAPPTLEALRAWVKVALPAYAAPSELEITDVIPRTASGKVRRSEITPP